MSPERVRLEALLLRRRLFDVPLAGTKRVLLIKAHQAKISESFPFMNFAILERIPSMGRKLTLE